MATARRHYVTLAALGAITHRVATMIADAGDDGAPVPVAIYSPNDYRVLAVALSVMRAGGMIVPVHADNPVDVTQRFLVSIAPRIAFFHSSLRDRVAKLRAALPVAQNWMCLGRQLHEACRVTLIPE